MKTAHVLTLSILLCTAMAAQAQQQVPQAGGVRGEISAQLEDTEFDGYDADGNGLLSIEEAGQAFPDRNIQDSNGDGWLNHRELEAAVPGLDLYDADIEGTWSPVGIYSYRRAMDLINGNPGGGNDNNG